MDTSFRLSENSGPVIVVVYMVQQINCIRNKAGDIIEVSMSCLRWYVCCSIVCFIMMTKASHEIITLCF